MSKKSKQKKSNKPDKKPIDFLKKHKLSVFLVLILALALFFSFPYQKYKDWDNAQLIKGLARDFPELVTEIEQATGAELEIESNCSTTTEKFGNGVKTCEVAVGYVGIPSKKDVEAVLVNNKNFTYTNQEYGTNITFLNKKACSVWYAAEDRFRVQCITAVREANTQLAIEEFSKALENN